MNKNKNTYSAPEADLLVVRFEQNFCESTNSIVSSTRTESFSGYDGDYGYEDL